MTIATPPAADAILLKSGDAAKLLNISTKTLWLHTSPRGRLKCIRIGSVLRYRRADLEAFIAGQVADAE